MEYILEVKNIAKSYAKHIALNDVSINIPKGSIFGLLGPNGAGKTSLIRIINQITGPDKGEVIFNGERLNVSHISKIGYLPEERGLYKKMRVGEQVLYLARLKGMPKEEAIEKLQLWFAKMNVLHWWDKKIEELSKGMQQKIQFITTVVHEPDLIILDEPFSGFDPINTNLIKKEILELKKQGTTIIFSTHNMESVEEICDHIALINNSVKILDGKVSDIKNQYKSNIFKLSFTGSLMGFTNALWAGYELLHTEETDNITTVSIKMLGNSSPNSMLAAILDTVQVQKLEEVVPNMNEIFIQKVTEMNGNTVVDG